MELSRGDKRWALAPEPAPPRRPLIAIVAPNAEEVHDHIDAGHVQIFSNDRWQVESRLKTMGFKG